MSEGGFRLGVHKLQIAVEEKQFIGEENFTFVNLFIVAKPNSGFVNLGKEYICISIRR